MTCFDLPIMHPRQHNPESYLFHATYEFPRMPSSSKFPIAALPSPNLNGTSTKNTSRSPPAISKPLHYAFPFSLAPLIHVLKSPTGNPLSPHGKSNVANIIAQSKYQPAMHATKKLPPLPFSNVAPTTPPSAIVQKDAAARTKPSMAEMKTRTKTRLVRREQMR